MRRHIPGQDEYARPDNATDAETDQIDRAERTFELMIDRFALNLGDGLFDQESVSTARWRN
jgi:hypothetical protein